MIGPHNKSTLELMRTQLKQNLLYLYVLCSRPFVYLPLKRAPWPISMLKTSIV